MAYDVETEHPILAKRDVPVAGIRYASGWTDYLGMGVAVVGCALSDGRFDFFFGDQLADFFDLARGCDYVVSWNGSRFDSKLLAAHGCSLPVADYDLMAAWQRATGKMVGLGAVARSNLGEGKSGDGAEAPLRWQRGEIWPVVDYCLDDARITAALWRLAGEQGVLMCPKTGRGVDVRGQIGLFMPGMPG